MQIKIDINTKQVQDALAKVPGQAQFAIRLGMNRTAVKARTAVVNEMKKVFDRPTPWVINSLRVAIATKAKPFAELAFKDKFGGFGISGHPNVESGRSMIEPHVYGGTRHFKVMEVRLLRSGLLPAGYNAVPGAAAKLDGNGNMSPGQITTLLNVLGAYTEAGYNKADYRTVKRLAKGGLKSSQYGQYGFVYWVKKVGSTTARSLHLQPGVYQRVSTSFGTTLKPVLIFVKRANYRQRLDFYGIAQATIDKEWPGEFSKAFDEAMSTALLKQQGSLL